jgi:hypothetical protein
MFFTHYSHSNNAESASQALFDLKVQLTPLLEKSQHSTSLETLPPVTHKLTSMGSQLYDYKDPTSQIPNP